MGFAFSEVSFEAKLAAASLILSDSNKALFRAILACRSNSLENRRFNKEAYKFTHITYYSVSLGIYEAVVVSPERILESRRKLVINDKSRRRSSPFN